MEMGREIQRRAKALNECDGPTMPRPYAMNPPCTSTLVSEESAQKGTKDLCGESCIPCTAVAERIRKREDPLTYGNDWNHEVYEMRGGLRHSPAATGRAESTTLAREGNEPIVSARIAMDAQKSMSEDPTFEIGADLSLDKTGDGRALPSRPSQKGLELIANDLVKKGLFGLVAFVFDGGKQSIGTMRARALPATASDVPRSPGR